MTIQEAKDFLNRGYRSRERIKVKEERIDEWIRRAESITAEIKPVATFSSTPSKKVEEAACAIVDLQSEIKAEIYELAAIELEIGRAINQAVTDPTLNALLEMRYLKYLKWEEIAVRLDITFRWTMTLHKKALAIFTESALIHAEHAL